MSQAVISVFKELFRLYRSKATGILIQGRELTRTLLLENGDLVFAQSQHPEDRLTTLLVDMGKITAEQLDTAMKNLNPAHSIGRNLIDMGFITQRDLIEVARAQVERVVWSAMASGEAAEFQERKELDEKTVRLPSDTAQMLLQGVLAFPDREGLLEMLGPLGQVVILETKRLKDFQLSGELQRVLPLMDGSRTLLELSREAGVDPFRLGAFVLFLREIGWARLHELPPVDRRGLEMALTAPEEPPSPEPRPPLIAAIEQSALPTTNLEHLSHALDEPVEEPLAEIEAQEGPEPESEWEDPAEEEPPVPIRSFSQPIEEATTGVRPPLSIAPEEEPHRIKLSLDEDEEPQTPSPTPLVQGAKPSPTRRFLPWIIVLGAALAVGVSLAYFLNQRMRTSNVKTPKPPLKEQPAPFTKPTPIPPPASSSITQPNPIPPPKTPPEPAPKSEAAAVPTKHERQAALRERKFDLARKQGQAYLDSLPKEAWLLRLAITCKADSIPHILTLLSEKNPSIFILPFRFRTGKDCDQVLLGFFKNEREARQAADNLPKRFLKEAGGKPRLFQVANLPKGQ